MGELQPARDLMERLLRVASPLGLYAEEFDADTGRHLGNFPQAFSHLALIEAAADLDDDRLLSPERELDLLTARGDRLRQYCDVISGRTICAAASISARWEKACGKFPR